MTDIISSIGTELRHRHPDWTMTIRSSIVRNRSSRIVFLNRKFHLKGRFCILDANVAIEGDNVIVRYLAWPVCEETYMLSLHDAGVIDKISDIICGHNVSGCSVYIASHSPKHYERETEEKIG